ncbi:helix-turn-helix domain-containing protein [Demequina activiva]|uniref:Helix-turn-helix domain-containing protein n=1 Tax=Demequina activiva TaxID=1582364 RepID=A0A919Q294_9MICO|nr:hypothetical protein Dac01nite_12930 [Demequina activiva]
MWESDLDHHELVVYIALLTHRSDAGEAWPSRTTLARESKVSLDSVKRTLRKLEARGLIEITRRKNGKQNASNLYRVDIYDPAQHHASKSHANLKAREVGAGSAYPGAVGTEVGCPEHQEQIREQVIEHG